MMNINCIICSDLFNPTNAIYITRCGHMFHYTCLTQWIERSKTCPQCRFKTNEKSIFRVFFNIVTIEGGQDDAVALQSKLDAANLQLRLNENHIKSTEDKINKLTDENASLETKYKLMKQDCDTARSGLNSVKEKLNFYKDRAKLVDKVENEIQQLKESVRSKDQAMRAITGSIDEANDIISSNACPKTLAIIASSLKKELQLVEKKKNNYFTSMKRAENELHSCRKELDSANVDRDILKRDLAAHKHCEEEMQILRTKISEIMNSSKVVDPAIARVVAESPAPSRIKTKNKLDGISPTIADRVKEIKDSNSPYLKVKSSSMGLLMKSQDTGPRFGSNNLSIFKTMPSSSLDDLTTIKKPLPEYNYDGFGGHSKDDNFPVPRPRPTTGVKRTKSSMSSSKFRKLAKPNKKLDDFLDICDLD